MLDDNKFQVDITFSKLPSSMKLTRKQACNLTHLTFPHHITKQVHWDYLCYEFQIIDWYH